MIVQRRTPRWGWPSSLREGRQHPHPGRGGARRSSTDSARSTPSGSTSTSSPSSPNVDEEGERLREQPAAGRGHRYGGDAGEPGNPHRPGGGHPDPHVHDHGLLVMSVLDIGIDQMSLAALIIALGMLVDNAIVMSESIMVQMAEGQPAVQAAVARARAADSASDVVSDHGRGLPADLSGRVDHRGVHGAALQGGDDRAPLFLGALPDHDSSSVRHLPQGEAEPGRDPLRHPLLPALPDLLLGAAPSLPGPGAVVGLLVVAFMGWDASPTSSSHHGQGTFTRASSCPWAAHRAHRGGGARDRRVRRPGAAGVGRAPRGAWSTGPPSSARGPPVRAHLQPGAAEPRSTPSCS